MLWQAILFRMDTDQILAAIDAEIQKLREVRSLLSGQPVPARRAKKRTMSPEGRARVAAAQRAKQNRRK
jgi:hypothetical protein